MELAPYLDSLRRDLIATTAAAGPEVSHAGELLAGSLEVAARMCLLEALSDAAAEITTQLAHGSVDVRLRGRDAQIVVTQTAPAAAAVPPPGATPGGADAETGDIARLTLRLPESLKDAVERAATAESISVNAWLVRAISQVLSGPQSGPGPRQDRPVRGRQGRRVTGFAQA